MKSKAAMLKELSLNLLLITLGSAVCAVAVNGILIPQGFLSGGFTGLALGIHYLFPKLPLSWIYFLLNVPVFALGWAYVGRRFFLYSIFGMVAFSVFVEVIHVPLQIEDKVLAALFAGIVLGVGSGVILKSYGSAGGLDIVSVILLERFSIRLGSTSLAFNSVILGVGAIVFSLDQILYTLVFIYVSAQVLNLVVTGLSRRKTFHIISSRWKEVSQAILQEVNRGVTIIPSEGAYTGKEGRLLYTVVGFREVPIVKSLIRAIDPQALVVISDTLEVMGHRIGNQPHW